jgi:hypothetical protein
MASCRDAKFCVSTTRRAVVMTVAFLFGVVVKDFKDIKGFRAMPTGLHFRKDARKFP